MSDPKPAPRSSMKWADDHRDLYLSSGGTQGHLFDFGPINGEGVMPICLIKHLGRKTGRTLILPLIYGMFNGEVVICASKGGAPADPAWYLNITAADHVEFQIGAQAFRATWREPAGDERQRAWELMVAIYPPYTAYQENTERLIPLVLMKPVAAVPVFTAADLTG
ncbi:MAG: nitroreductase/quinone reductase family protein [Novosphingobium sp.]